MRRAVIGLLCAVLAASSCSKRDEGKARPAGTVPISIALNWVPEPEFGGIYEAALGGQFVAEGLDAEIRPGGAGAPAWQRVATGQADYAVAGGEDVVIARVAGADVVAIFAIYQVSPRAIMVHASRGLKRLDEVFESGVLAIEPGAPFAKFLEKKFGAGRVKRIPYAGGVTNFLADRDFAQQCFVSAEPVVAKRLGGDPQTFLVADAGYDPYAAVVVTSGARVRSDPAQVAGVARALARGWQEYIRAPERANAHMARLNASMEREDFAAAAEAQKALVVGRDAGVAIGSMRAERWAALVATLGDLGLVTNRPAAESCFVNPPAERPPK